MHVTDINDIAEGVTGAVTGAEGVHICASQ
jgi:hypothetical protein